MAPPRRPPGAAAVAARHPLRRRPHGLAVAPAPRARVAPRRVPRGGPALLDAAGRAPETPTIDAERRRPRLRGAALVPAPGGCRGGEADPAWLTRRRRVPAVLGLDLGTSEAKAALVGLDGTLLGLGRAGYPTDLGADGRAEQDPRDWWAAIASATRSLGGAVAGRSRCWPICGVGQGPTLVARRRRRGSPSGPRSRGRTGDPARAASGCCRGWRGWRQRSDAVDRARVAARVVGRRGRCGSAARRRRTLQAHETDAVGRASCRRPASGPGWSRARCRSARGSGRSARRSPTRWACPPASRSSPVSTTARRRCSGRGSATRAMPSTRAGRRAGSGSTPTAPSRCRACSRSGAAARAVGRGRGDGRAGRIGRLAARPGAGRAMVQPTSCWPRPPPCRPGRRRAGVPALPRRRARAALRRAPRAAAFFGLTLGHDARHLARAVLEGTAFAMRSVAEPLAAAGAPIRELRLTGRSAAGRHLGPHQGRRPRGAGAIPPSADTAALGAAILAAAGVGAVPSLEAGVAAMTSVARADRAGSGLPRRYDEPFARYRALYPALRGAQPQPAAHTGPTRALTASGPYGYFLLGDEM